MSIQSSIKRKTAPEIRARKGGEPIVMLTSYHAHTAALVDRHCDVILVGDSLGNVMHGFETTVPVTLEMMILQGRAVMRGSSLALVVVDMPFGSYEASKEQAFHSAVRIMKETQCGAVKLEGGARMAETVAFLSQRGIPVMGHIGLTPQSINALGSFRAQGREGGSWEPIETDAGAISQAGAFSVVIEAVAEPLARKITQAIAIPTIGIGASSACDGQVLVLEDMLGLSPRTPKFVRRYGNLGPAIEAAVEGYAKDVRSRAFPGPETKVEYRLMNVLFVHNNFPAQYRYLARALARDPNVKMVAIGSSTSRETSLCRSTIKAVPPGLSTRFISRRAPTGSEKFLNAAMQTTKSNDVSAKGIAAALPWRTSMATPALLAFSRAILTKDLLISNAAT